MEITIQSALAVLGVASGMIGIQSWLSRFLISKRDAEIESLRREHKRLEEKLCGIDDAHKSCAKERRGDERIFSDLGKSLDLLAQELRTGFVRQDERLEVLQSQILRDLSGVSDGIELRIRRDLDPLLRLAAESPG